MLDIAVILINYNSSQFTQNCIDSIRVHTSLILSYKIIVVDNKSESEDVAKLEHICKDRNVELIKSPINTGFGGGNMIGANAVEARYLFFLNNDCELINDNLSLLFNFMENHSEAAMCIGQMFDSNLKYHTSFNYTPHIVNKLLGNSLARIIYPKLYPKKKLYDTSIEVPQIYGAAMFIRQEYFQKIGGFDTNIFLYFEEEDVAIRFQKKGYKAYLVPDAKFKHHIGSSTKGRRFSYEKEFYLSMIYSLRKNYSLIHFKSLQLLLLFKLLRRSLRKKYYFQIFLFVLKGAPREESLRCKNG